MIRTTRATIRFSATELRAITGYADQQHMLFSTAVRFLIARGLAPAPVQAMESTKGFESRADISTSA
jgi:hypothetical protein